MNKKTESMNEKFKRLEEIKQELQRNMHSPDLDKMMPFFEEANKIEEELTKDIDNTLKTIEEKRAKRNK